MHDNGFFKLICDHSCDEIWVTDGHGNTLYVNPACEQFYGEKPEAFLGRNVRDLERDGYFHPAVAPIVIARKARVTLTQRTRTGKVMLITGTPVLDDDGNVKYVVENSRDITALEEMKRDFERVQALANRYKMELEALKSVATDTQEFICTSKPMFAVLQLAARAAASDSNVLITGESGTGKDVLARYIHRNSARATGPFLKVSCPAVPTELLESELFGYRAGAFTGASRHGKPGLLELANGGTVLLDEIGDLPLSLQPKLLQVVEERAFIPVGATRPVVSDIRIISATNRDLRSLVKAGRFRADLYYRLSVINIEMPPLRERKDEIPEFVRCFLRKLSNRYGVTKNIAPEALEALKSHDWPGNIRELEHLIEYLFVTCQSNLIQIQDLPQHVRQHSKASAYNVRGKPKRCQSVSQLEALYDNLRSTYKVAKVTGLSQSTVYRLIREHVKRRKFEADTMLRRSSMTSGTPNVS